MIYSSELFKLAMLSNIIEVHVKIELLDQQENVIDVFNHHVSPESIGDISVDSERDIRRMFTMTFDNGDGKFTWNEGELIWIDNKLVRLSIGLGTSKGIEYVPMGVFVLTQPSATHKPLENTVSISGQDKWYLLTGNFGRFTHETTIAKNTNIKEAIRIVAQAAGVTKMILEDCNIVLPYDLTYQIGQNRGVALKELASKAFVDGEYFYDIYYDVNGYLRFEKHKDPLKEAPCWTYKEEDETLYAGSARKLDDTELFNHILVLGGSSQTAEIRSEITIDSLFEKDLSTGLESGMSASSMYAQAYSPDNLTDGNIVFGGGTAYASASGAQLPQWFQIDLGSEYSISKVRWINNRTSSCLPKNYTISVSLTGLFNGEETIVANAVGNTTYANWVEHKFNPLLGRYVRMTVSSISNGSYFELSEWQVYGNDSPYSVARISDRFNVWNNGNPDSNIDTQAQGDARAKFEIKKSLSYAEEVEVDIAPNYLHEANDVIEVIDQKNGCSGNYQLKQFTIPINPKITTARALKIRGDLIQ